MSILEKAWVKLIGSYEKAKGLSPEDAIEEILGIPAYSYDTKNIELGRAIKLNKQERGCVLFIAR